jgi:hypothetical protein
MAHFENYPDSPGIWSAEQNTLTITLGETALLVLVGGGPPGQEKLVLGFKDPAMAKLVEELPTKVPDQRLFSITPERTGDIILQAWVPNGPPYTQVVRIVVLPRKASSLGPEYVIVFGQDIKSDDDLEELGGTYQKAVESSGEGIVVVASSYAQFVTFLTTFRDTGRRIGKFEVYGHGFPGGVCLGDNQLDVAKVHELREQGVRNRFCPRRANLLRRLPRCRGRAGRHLPEGVWHHLPDARRRERRRQYLPRLSLTAGSRPRQDIPFLGRDGQAVLQQRGQGHRSDGDRRSLRAGHRQWLTLRRRRVSRHRTYVRPPAYHLAMTGCTEREGEAPMVHALRQMRAEMNPVPTWDGGYDNEEEFFAIVVANTYLSEMGVRALRANHADNAILSADLDTSEKFLGKGESPPARAKLENRRMLNRLMNEDYGLCRYIADGVDARCNPIGEYFKRYGQYPHVPGMSWKDA